MSTEQEDRGVEPESDETILTGENAGEDIELPHILDALGNPAAPEDDLAGD